MPHEDGNRELNVLALLDDYVRSRLGTRKQNPQLFVSPGTYWKTPWGNSKCAVFMPTADLLGPGRGLALELVMLIYLASLCGDLKGCTLIQRLDLCHSRVYGKVPVLGAIWICRTHTFGAEAQGCVLLGGYTENSYVHSNIQLTRHGARQKGKGFIGGGNLICNK